MTASTVGVSEMIQLQDQVLGYPITVTAVPAGSDWNITVLGGCAPHVGSVSLAECENGQVTLRTLLRDTHKDQIVGDKFACTLAQQQQCAVCVSCGIHYDGPGETDLKIIVACTDRLLNTLCQNIKKESTQ